MREPFATKVEDFGGMYPRRADQLLGASEAVFANNCRLLSGNIEGLKQLFYVENLTASPLYTGEQFPLAAFPIGDNVGEVIWKPFRNRETHFVRAPITNDDFNRYYWTGDGEPMYETEEQLRAGSDGVLLGVPAPVNSLTLVPAITEPQSGRAYTYTFISPYGEEGPPATPTNGLGGEGTWTVSGFDTDIPDLYRRAPGDWKVRIYRTVTGDTATLYYFVDEVPLGTTTYEDSQFSDDVALNSLLESEDWEPPPAGLDFLTAHPNGFLVGAVGTDIYMSVQYRPHAWPSEWVLSTEFPIVGLGIFGQTIVVLTKANPYLLSGSDPQAVTFTKTNSVVPCVSRFGIVNFDYGVAYPAERGMMLVDGTEVRNITHEFLLGDQWQRDYNPTGLIASARYDEQYLAFCTCDRDIEDVTHNGFMFSPLASNPAHSRLDEFTYVDNLVINEIDGKLYMLRSGNLYEWDRAEMPPVQYTWKSKVFDFPYPVNWGAARISMDTSQLETTDDPLQDSYELFNSIRIGFPLAPIANSALGSARGYDIATPVPENKDPFAGSALRTFDLGLNYDLIRFRIWADGELVYETLARSHELLPLPAGFKVEHWQFEVVAYQPIRSVQFGSSPEALKQA